jgi:hypothetical protein
MVHHRIVTAFASGVLVVLAAGCASERTGAELLAGPPAGVTASQLSGTWRGEIWAVGTDSTSVLNRDVTLEIKDDATYRLISSRMGTTSSDSGVAVRDGSAVILKSSSGQWISLQRSGDKLYGVYTMSGRRMHIMVEQAP